MADIIATDRKLRSRAGGNAAVQRDTGRHDTAAAAGEGAGLLLLVEMLFFAYRDFTGEADAVLATYELGRAHHRVLHFVNRRPGIRVADLLQLLKITKQSLGRVLRKLVADGWVDQAPGPDDRRERRLTLTPRGRDLAAALAALQTGRIDAALREIDAGAATAKGEHVRDFLFALIASEERAAVSEIVLDAATDGAPIARLPRQNTGSLK